MSVRHNGPARLSVMAQTKDHTMDAVDTAIRDAFSGLRAAEHAAARARLDRLTAAYAELMDAAKAVGVSTYPTFHAKALPPGVIVAAGQPVLVSCQWHSREHHAATWHALAPGNDPPKLCLSRLATAAEIEASEGPAHHGDCEWFRSETHDGECPPHNVCDCRRKEA